MGSKIIRKQENQSASSAQRGTSGIGGPLGEQIESNCIGIGVGVSVAGIGLGMMVGFTPQGNGCSSTDLGIGSVDIVQVGCDVIVTKTLAGVVIETEHRTAKECKPPEPPKPPGDEGPSNNKPGGFKPNVYYHVVVFDKFKKEENYEYSSIPPYPFLGIRTVEDTWGNPYVLLVSQGDSNPPKYRFMAINNHKRIQIDRNGNKTTIFQDTQYDDTVERNPCDPTRGASDIYTNPGTGRDVFWNKIANLGVAKGLGTDLEWFFDTPAGEEVLGFTKTNSSSIGTSKVTTYQTTNSVIACESPSYPPNLFPPKQMSDCCNATTAMLRKIMKVLAVEDIEKNGIKIPKEFLAPGGTGQLKVSNYAELQLNLFRTVNRYGIDTPIRVKIKDVNKAKKGDQSVDVQFNSPAAAIQALVELALENKGDAATRLQIQVRLIYAVTRTLKMVAGIGETVREIIKMLGSPFKWTTTRLPLEFDLSAGITTQSKSGEGFGDKKKQPLKNESEDGLAPGLEANDEDTTESLLPAILTPTDYPLPVPRFVETEDDLQDLLVKAILLLGSKK